MSRRIYCKTTSEAGMGKSGLSDNQYVKEARVPGDGSNVSLVSKASYSLRSGDRKASSSVRSRAQRRPMAFVSQLRERYFSEDDDDSISSADDEGERDGTDFLPEADGESNDLHSDEIHKHITRPQITDDVDMPVLILPETAVDLVIDAEFSLQAVGIYQVLRQFSRILRLSLFRFEDFCFALTVTEQTCLLAETHIALLKCILQEEDCSNSTFGPTDARDSINISLYLIDAVTWFEAVRMYLESLSSSDDDFQQVLRLFTGSHYQDLNTSQRLLLLQILTDLFLATNLVREAMMKEGAFIHEEQCRFCHRRGDLICCETCPAVFHLECLKPPLTAVPDDDWFCCLCSALQVKGVNECLSDMKKDSLLCRLEPIGYDRHQRKYWFLCRRVFVEADGRAWYYSTPAQLEEMLLALDEKWEMDLLSALKAIKSVIVEQMAITEELTNKVKGKRKSALAAHDEILKDQRLKMNESLQTVNDEDSVKQGVECSEDDRKPNKTLNENVTKTNLEERFGVQDLMKSKEREEVKVENGADDDPKVSTCQSQGEEFELDESKKCETVRSSLAGNISIESNVTILKEDDVVDGAVSNATNAAVLPLPPPPPPPPTCTDLNHSPETDLQNIKGKSNDNDEIKTAESFQKLSSITESLPFAEDIKKFRSNTAVEMSSSLSSDSICEMRQTRSKSKYLVGSNAFDAYKQSNCEQNFLPYPVLFKLGIEGNYRTYVNLYSTNPLALSKQQQNDDREKKRHLSYKFSLTPLSEFVWNGVIYGQSRQSVDAVKRILFHLEGNIDQCFLHPNWCQNSGRWQKAVSLCSTAADFGLALMILEASMKLLLFNSVWHESLGHIKLRRTTAAEKEEQKKKEKDLKRIRYEDEYATSAWVKYSLGLHHQVWKQKGEEYRSTGKGGWFWVSSTRLKQSSNLKNSSLFQIFRKNCQSDEVGLFSKSIGVVSSQESNNCEFIKPSTGDRNDGYESSEYNDMKQITEKTDINCGAVKLSEAETEENEIPLGKLAEGTFRDCFNVSEALLSRSFYKKKSAINCVLDSLLKRRTRQLELEIEQKAALELALQKFHADAFTEYIQPKGSSSSESGLYSGNSKSLISRRSGSYVAKLNFATHKAADSEHSKGKIEERKEGEAEEEEEEDNSDNEVTLEKEDLEDSNSVDGCAVGCQVQDVAMSEDSNISNASSLAANIIPPPVQSKSLCRTLLEQNCCSAKAFQEVSVSDKRLNESVAAAAEATQIEISCSHNVINSLQKYIKDGNIILTKDIAKEIDEKLKEVGKIQFQVRLLKQINSVAGKKKRRQIKRGSIPRAQNFLTRSNKRSLFVLERDELAVMARKGGQKEALGFNYASKIHDFSWPYPCPRPFFKTAWRYRTQTAKNLSAIALQLRILWANIRWDEMATKCTVGKNTTISETEVTTVELLKRRETGLTNLRAEYLIQKTVSPLDVPVPSKERALPSQRSGLRERRQQEAPISRELVISEFWVPEEQLELWQVKLFAERLEKKQHKQKEKASEKKPKTMTAHGKSQESNSSTSRTSSQSLVERRVTAEPIVKVGSAAVEEELQQQRMLMRQKRLGLSFLRGEQSDRMNSSSSASMQGSVNSATSTSASQNNTPRSLKLPFRRLGGLKTNNTAVLRSTNMMPHAPVISCTASAPAQAICLPGSGNQCLTSAASVVCAPMTSPLTTSSAVQSIRIRKGPDGQLQITGLQPGQEIIRLPDGRLRLVAKPLPIDKQEECNYSGNTSPLKLVSSTQPDKSLAEVCNAAKVQSVQLKTSSYVQQQPQNRKEGVKGATPELVLPSADKQTSVTVATAVEKLFACLSPLRLQRKQGFSEKAICSRQLSSAEGADFVSSPTGGHAMVDPVGERLQVSTAHSMQFNDIRLSSAAGVGFPSQAEPTCVSLPSDSDIRCDKSRNQFPVAKVPDDDVDCPAVLSDQPDFCSMSQNIAWKGEACSESAGDGSLPHRQWPSCPKEDLTEEGIFNRHNSKAELSLGISLVSDTASPAIGCSNETRGSRKRRREGSAGAVAVEEELPESSRKKEAGCKSLLAKESQGNEFTLKRRKTTSDATVSDEQLISQTTHGKCKRKLSSTGIKPNVGEPLKNYQSGIRQLTGDNRGALDVNRRRMEQGRRSDKGEPSRVTTEAMMKQSGKTNDGGSSSRSCTLKQNLRKLATDEMEKLFCTCKTRYDPSRFYVGCDVCLNWFHGSCVNVSKEEVFAIGSFVCSACKAQQSNRKGEIEELFCICHQPYDKSLFYIGCNDCGGWFHGSCVNVSPSDAGRMNCYTCPTCNVKKGCRRVEIQAQHLPSLKKLISSLQLNSLAKPVCKLTNKADNQGCLEVMKERIDFSVVEQRIESRTYFLLEDFVTDVLEIFSNCRMHNNRMSPIFIRAIAVEMEFMNKFEKLRTEIFQR